MEKSTLKTNMIKMDKSLTTSSRLILESIRSTGFCSQKDLSAYTGLSERSVRNSLRQLKNKGLIFEAPDPNDGRRREYIIIKSE